MSDLLLPGQMKVPGAPQPSEAQILVAQISALTQLVDMFFQAQMRIAAGWDPQDVFREMALNVEPPPGDPVDYDEPKHEEDVAEGGQPKLTPAMNRAQRRAAIKLQREQLGQRLRGPDPSDGVE